MQHLFNGEASNIRRAVAGLSGARKALRLFGNIPVVGELADVASGVISLAAGDYVGAAIDFGSAIPGVGNGVRAAGYAVDGAKAAGASYRSFSAFKRAHGAAGKGHAWHHVVEQTPANVAKFGAERIHSVDNLVTLPHGAGTLHNKVSGFYSSRAPGGGRIRDWVSTKSFEEQFDFGVRAMQKLSNP